MFLLIGLTVIEFAVFIITAIVFLIALKFYIDSKKKLQEYMKGDEALTMAPIIVKTETATPSAPKKEKFFTREEPNLSSDINKMKEMLLQQQKELSRALDQINQVQQTKTRRDESSLEKRLEELQLIIEKKDSEIRSLRQQTELAKEMQSHFNSLQDEVDFLQEKLARLEQQAWQANELAIKVESMEQTQQHLEKELLRKEEKITELSAENQRLNTLLHSTEDKLQEANMQRQQLQKKIQFLEEMNNDMKLVSETNRKLQTEIRRIAELESMLNLIMEERDELLRQRQR